jgi:hypothetical protein
MVWMLPMMSVDEELEAFDAGQIEPAVFPHREHLRFAYEILGRCSFAEAALRFRHGLGFIAQKAGKPELYHETITVAFLAAIAECRARTNAADWNEFIAANPDLLDKNVLLRWYSKEQLDSQLARTTFVLPRPFQSSD